MNLTLIDLSKTHYNTWGRSPRKFPKFLQKLAPKSESDNEGSVEPLGAKLPKNFQNFKMKLALENESDTNRLKQDTW